MGWCSGIVYERVCPRLRVPREVFGACPWASLMRGQRSGMRLGISVQVLPVSLSRLWNSWFSRSVWLWAVAFRRLRLVEIVFSVAHARGNFCGGGGGGFRQPWTPQSSKCLTHTQTPQPMLRSESDRFANPMLHPATTQKDKTAVYVCARHEKESRHAQTAGLNLNFLHHLQSP